jgi:hypothetical protein
LVVVTSRLIRGVWLLSAISIVALSAPLRGDVAQLRLKKSDCCAHLPAHRGHCGSEPTKPASAPDRPCCSSYVLALPIINVPPARYIFDGNDGEEFVTLIVNQKARFLRPPVPPPRV